MVKYDSYRRNKRDIDEVTWHDGECYTFYGVIGGTYNKGLVYARTNEAGKSEYICMSYDTIVAEYRDGKIYTYGYYSCTTARHINWFANRLGYKGHISKKELEQNIVLTLDK